MFDIIAGYEDVKNELSLILGWYEDSEQADKAKLPRGILLTGHPGTGKTLFLKSIKDEVMLPVLYFEEQKDEDPEDTLRALFEKAASYEQGVVVIIDEVDRLIEDDRAFKRVLKEMMDGIVEFKRILVIASAESTYSFDDALLRPGRFDRIIKLRYPDPEDRKEIFKQYLGKHGKELNDADLSYLVLGPANSVTCAEIAAVVEDACLRNGKGTLSVRQIEDSVSIVSDQVLPSGKSQEQPMQICVHEIGHAVMIDHYRSLFNLQRVSVEKAAGDHEGVCHYSLRGQEINSAESMLAKIDIELAGYYANLILTGEICCGSFSDLKKARYNARMLINSLGYAGAAHVLREYDKYCRNESWITCFFNERRATRIIRRSGRRVKRVIRSHKEQIMQLAKKLQENGYLYGTEVREVMAESA